MVWAETTRATKVNRRIFMGNIPLVAKSSILVAVVLLFLAQGVSPLHAGHPAPQCPVEGHKGPICNMHACARYGPDGKVTGSRCSKFCAKTCCGCGEECTRAESNPD